MMNQINTQSNQQTVDVVIFLTYGTFKPVGQTVRPIRECTSTISYVFHIFFITFSISSSFVIVV
jgi:hypothetical protein